MADPKPFPGAAEFLFGAPLYEVFSYRQFRLGTVPKDIPVETLHVRRLFNQDFKLDGYCPFCRRRSTFERTSGGLSDEGWSWFHSQGVKYEGDLVITCARNDSHTIWYILRGGGGVLQKVGQFPSFADIANDESKQYRTLLSTEDAAELHKAIGLAAHGVGIGAYVYIRRIFERLIDNRFAEFKTLENWPVEDFRRLRVAEKIEFLKDHLPDFLVKNKKLYGILSLGIHELNEADCLNFFSVIRASTIFILEEDKRKKEELAQRAAVEKAIEQYVPPKAEDEGAAAEATKESIGRINEA